MIKLRISSYLEENRTIKIASILIALAVIATNYYIYRIQLAGMISTDILEHVGFSQKMATNLKPHFLLHILILITQNTLGITPEDSTLYLLTFFTIINISATAYLIKTCAGNKCSWETSLIFSAIISITSGINWPSFCTNIFLCAYGPNVFVSPTITIVKPFAVLSLIVYSRLNNNPREKNTLVILTFLLGLSLLAKPNFAIAFVPAIFIKLTMCKSNRMTKVYWRNSLLIAFFTTTILLIQYYINYGPHNPVKQGIIFDYLGVAKLYSPNPFISSFLGAAFPLATTALFRFSNVLCGNCGHAGTVFWKGLAGRFDSFPVVRKMMFVRLRSDLNPLALTMAA